MTILNDKKYISISRTNMSSLEFRLKKKIDKIKNHLSEEIKHNDLMSEQYKKTCRFLNCFENFNYFNLSTIESLISKALTD